MKQRKLSARKQKILDSTNEIIVNHEDAIFLIDERLPTCTRKLERNRLSRSRKARVQAIEKLKLSITKLLYDSKRNTDANI